MRTIKLRDAGRRFEPHTLCRVLDFRNVALVI